MNLSLQRMYKVRFSMELDESTVKKTTSSPFEPYQTQHLKNTVLKHGSAWWWVPSNFLELNEHHLVWAVPLSSVSF